MTVTAIDIEEVKASVDAALQALQKELRELNYQVWILLHLALCGHV
jgi:hypothetical protein